MWHFRIHHGSCCRLRGCLGTLGERGSIPGRRAGITGIPKIKLWEYCGAIWKLSGPVGPSLKAMWKSKQEPQSVDSGGLVLIGLSSDDFGGIMENALL